MNKKILKISQLQIQGLEEPVKNSELIKENLLKTIPFNPDIISTPECSNIITSDRAHLFKYATYQSKCPVLDVCLKFAKKYKKIVHIGSLLLKKKNSKKLLNRSFLINKEGKIIDYYDKIHLFDVNINSKEIHRESQSFNKGKKIVVCKIKQVTLGLSICYDIRFPALFRDLTKKGAQIIFIPSAFTVPTGKDHWETLLRTRAIENTVFVVATAQCGRHHNNRKTYGHSMIINPWGKIIRKTTSLPKILNSSINLEEIKVTRLRMPSIYHD
ncbi:MAG: nitrilase-related carbon-nitrogen hydrolase [Pseudomonadota bacterium]|jgi:predicted amidohydrolase|nr:nitrilase-related carbon-nitrogen hydrolase [Pseudomonadota bacterium]